MKKIYDNYYVTEDGKVFNNFKQLSPSNIRNMGFNYELIRKIKRKKTWTHISKDYNF